MRNFLRILALVLWLLTGMLFLSRWWYANPDAFPHFSESFWHQLDRLFGASNVDSAQNVEFIVVAMSLLCVLAVTAVGLAIARYAWRRR